MNLVTFRDAVIASIAAHVPAFRAVQKHGGTFTLADLKRIAVQEPACLVAVFGGPIQKAAGEGKCLLDTQAFIVTKGTSSELRVDAAPALASAVVMLAVEDTWAVEDTRAPEDIRLENLYIPQLDTHGVALWRVRWKQLVPVTAFDLSELDEFKQLNVKTDITPVDGIVEQEFDVWLSRPLMRTYGQLSVGTPQATNVSAVGADTYLKAAGTTSLGSASDFDMPVDGRLRYNGSSATMCLIEATASALISEEGKVTLAIAKNGVVAEETAVEDECSYDGGPEAYALKHIVELSPNDYVEVWLKVDDIVDVTLTKLNLIVIGS